MDAGAASNKLRHQAPGPRLAVLARSSQDILRRGWASLRGIFHHAQGILCRPLCRSSRRTWSIQAYESSRRHPVLISFSRRPPRPSHRATTMIEVPAPSRQSSSRHRNAVDGSCQAASFGSLFGAKSFNNLALMFASASGSSSPKKADISSTQVRSDQHSVP